MENKTKVIDQTVQLNRVLRLLEQDEIEINERLRLFKQEDVDRRRMRPVYRYDPATESAERIRQVNSNELFGNGFFQYGME